MLDNFKKIYALLERTDRPKMMLVMLLMTFTAFIQTAGVASIMPFLTVLANQDMIEKNLWLRFFFTEFGFTSRTAFLYFLGFIAFASFIFGTFLQAATYWVVVRYSQMQQYHLSRRLMADYLHRPYVFFLSRNSSDLAKTVLQETDRAISGTLLPAMRLIGFVLLALTMSAFLIAVQPWLALSIVVVLGSAYGVIYLGARVWLNRIGQDRLVANRERFTAAAEAFAGAKEIRLLGREDDYLERYRQPSQRLARHQATASLLQDLPQYVIEAIAFGGILVLALWLMRDEYGIAHALPVIGLYGLAGKQLIPAFQKIYGMVSAIRFNMPAVEEILNDLSTAARAGQPQVRMETVGLPLLPQRDIAIVDLGYRYPGNERWALRHVDLIIPARTTIGFVGASGAGKSTLIDLLLGLLEPEEGAILIDGTPLTADNVRRWQAALGYVPQHIFLADQHIAANIALGVPEREIDLAAVERAARLANLHEFIMDELPQGYRTLIGERGVRLSGGQRQRIGIARALYRNPAVLLFDEATSALDNPTEQAVMEAIHNLAGEKTILLVAHRLTTVKPCQRIHVLDQGQLVASGSWDELITHSAHFRTLAAGML